MKNFNPILAGATIGSVIISIQPLAMALSGQEVNNIAREVTVLVYSINPGSGVLIAQDDDIYYVLTAKHVVETEDEYSIITSDQQSHKIADIHRFPNVDLAVVEFSSNKNYEVATLANSNNATEGQAVFISGWPNPGTSIKTRIRQFTSGEISARTDEPLAGGYQIVYTNVTRAGMSGAPVFDSDGRVVGIHGQGEGEQIDPADQEQLGQAGLSSDLITNARLVGFNLGIPINTFLGLAPQNGLYLGVNVENSPPSDLTTPYVEPNEPDQRDVIDNIDRVLNIIDKIRRFFPF